MVEKIRLKGSTIKVLAIIATTISAIIGIKYALNPMREYVLIPMREYALANKNVLIFYFLTFSVSAVAKKSYEFWNDWRSR